MGKRVAILVGGGDVPGLNMCLKHLVYQVIDLGFEPIGVRKGWEGFIRYNPQDPITYGEQFIELTKSLVRPIDRVPGSFLHASRINPLHTPVNVIPSSLRQGGVDTQDTTNHIKDVIERLGYKALILIGDDDMLHYGAHLSKQGVPLIAIPKTVHNNINGTDYTIGFSSGLSRAVSFIHELRALAGSREQILVVETFKANSGLSSLMTAFLAGVDRSLIPEVPYDPQRLADLITRDKRATPGNYAIVTVSDGTRIESDKVEQYLPYLSEHTKPVVLEQLERDKKQKISQAHIGLGTHHHLVGSGMVTAELLQELTSEEVFMQPLTYLIRTGQPDGQDLFNATNFAILAARLLKEEKFGRMTARAQYELTDVDLSLVTEKPHEVDVNVMYDAKNYKPKVDLIWAAQTINN